MQNRSIWISNIENQINVPLKKDINVDVLIIGGGLTGISTAFNLKDSDLKVALVDADKVGYGVSSRSTGKLTYLQGLIYHKLETNFNYNTAKLYLESQKEAIRDVKKIVKYYNINCDLKKVSSITFTNQDKEISKIQKEEDFLKKAGIKFYIQDKLPVGISCKYSIKVDDTYVFNPVKYILKLKDICIGNGIDIYENTKILNIIDKKKYYICQTGNNKKIKACKVVVCCHYPFFVIPGLIPFKTHIEKSYITASQSKTSKDFSAITSNYPIKSIRYHNDKEIGDFVLFAGNSHKLCDKLNRKENYDKLILYVKNNISTKVKYLWTNHDIMTNDNLPLIGRLNKNNPNLLVGTGYNTWGMTNGVIAGKILSDIILEKNNRYIELFRPDRTLNFDKIKNFFLNMYLNAKGFFGPKIKKNHLWYKDKVKFERRNGKNVGIYIDEKGKKHIIYNLCPHLKCSLIFNMQDKTWDCPCHGSRFDMDGECIQGPSKYNIKYDRYKK